MPYFGAWRQDQYPAEDQLICQTIWLPVGDEYRAQLAGVLSLLADVNSYEDPESAQADGIAAVWDTANAQIVWEECLTSQWLLGNVRVYPEQAIAVSGAALAWADVAGQACGGIFRQTTGAINDKLTFNVALKAGGYALVVHGNKNSSRGIQTVKLDGVAQGTFDWYNATLQLNQTQNTVISIADDGLYELTSEMNSKNAASSGYTLQINYIDFLRV